MRGVAQSLIFGAALGLSDLPRGALSDTAAKVATQADKAFAKYGLTGKGVIIAILDRGID